MEAVPSRAAPQQARSKRSRAALVRAAQIEFSQRGYAATTVKTITRRARIGTGTFYHYFADKDEVLRELARERLDALTDRTVGMFEAEIDVSGGPETVVAHVRELMRRVIVATLREFGDDPGFRSVLWHRRFVDPLLDAEMQRAEAKPIERLSALLERWGYPGDAAATAYVMTGQVVGSTHFHSVGLKMVDDERLVDALVDAVARVALPLAQHGWPKRKRNKKR